jgi:endo-1,4-beta-xylanase
VAFACSTVPDRRPEAVAGGSGGVEASGGSGGGAGESAVDGSSGGTAHGDVLRASVSKTKPGVDCVGTAINAGVLSSDDAYRAIAASEFNCVVAEYGMKWDSMEPQQGTFDFTIGDQIVDFARQNGMRVKGHALVWHGATPSWVLGVSSPEALRAAITNFVTAAVTHFKGKVDTWDVVNEAIADSGGGLRNTHFYKVLGEDYFKIAFDAARAADPDVALLYNDYGGEGAGVKSDAIYELVKGLKQSGVPIDGIGLQSHLTHTGVSADKMSANLQRLADLGLSVNLSEIDVRMGMATGTLEEKLALQAEIYQQLAAACAKQPACTGLFVWGFTDAHSWVDGSFGGTNLPCLLDVNLVRKPAYAAFRAGLTP